ncbi:MAG: DUF1592 domain-containing protein [Phycisphaera sp.]|nr:DUF1592 domain-containing protein [Phycisphaera sp.]
MTRLGYTAMLALVLIARVSAHAAAPDIVNNYFEDNCFDCHDSKFRKGNLDLTALKFEPGNLDNFARWVKVFDRIDAGEMPPKDEPRPVPGETKALQAWLGDALRTAEHARLGDEARTGLRRLTRAEYENTIRDLFDMPGIALAGELPADGSAHGFDTNADALDISHVNLAKYIEAADHTLDYAIATRPQPPAVMKMRTALSYPAGFVAHVLMNGDGVLLRDKKPDPNFLPAAEHKHFDQGAHEQMGVFRSGATVGLFRHEDESFFPYFNEFVSIYPGQYRIRTSLWSFQWDKGQVLPSRGTEAARLSIVTLTGDGRGGGHPSTVLGYYDAPSMHEQVHEVTTWLNVRETFGFNTASLAPVANYSRKGHAMAFTGPAIACDWFDVEGPIHDVWPPVSHTRLFGDLPITEFSRDANPDVRPPQRDERRQPFFPGKNPPDPVKGVWTVHSDKPLVDADRLLADFLPRAFRRSVSDDVRKQYVAKVDERLKAGDCFETAMRWVYRAALCSPDFLYHVEPAGRLDDYALASRLSYFLWNSMPDDTLIALAKSGDIRKPGVLDAQVERLLKDPRSQRFVDNFLGQWLKLREIAATDPDRKLYPEFSTYLQNSMVAESRAYFRELIDKDLDASHLVRSDFAMLNQKLATHYGIPGVVGSQIRRVELPAGCPRGPFLTQAAILKVTANGTTTSPVPRGAFVMQRLLGQPPDPPPANVPAVEPDVRGAKTIREQLDKHRSDPTCASCHAKIDPPGFALESFDVIGGQRDRYRSIGEGDNPQRGSIDPFIGIGFKLGPHVDSSGALPDGRKFSDITTFQDLVASDTHRLLRNLASQLLIYSTGREVAFGDREKLAAIVDQTQKAGGGVRTLVHQIVLSDLFQTR